MFITVQIFFAAAWRDIHSQAIAPNIATSSPNPNVISLWIVPEADQVRFRYYHLSPSTVKLDGSMTIRSGIGA